MKTTMQAAFESAGVRRIDMEAYAAAQKFIKEGGLRERWVELFDMAAEKLPGEAVLSVPQGHFIAASARQPNGDEEGQSFGADKASLPLPSSSPRYVAAGFLRVREYTRAKRGMSVIAAAQGPSLLSVMDTMKVRDGRPWSKIKFGDLESIRFEGAREASIARQIMRHVANPDPEAFIPAAITLETFQRFVQRAAEVADAA